MVRWIFTVFFVALAGMCAFYIPEPSYGAAALGLFFAYIFWSGKEDLIPGDAATELYRLRMMLKEQAEQQRRAQDR